MIFKTASPISPDVELTIGDVQINYLNLQRIDLEQQENSHDLLILDFSGVAPEHIYDYLDKPVQVSIEFASIGKTEFVGYVVFVEPSSITKNGLVNQSPFQITRIYCLGPSYKMREKKTRSWENVTLNDIAKKIVNDYRYSLNMPINNYRFKRLVQTEASDWEFVVNTANMLGYSVAMDGTTLHIWDPFQAISRSISYTVLRTLKGSNGSVQASNGQILRFDATVGAVTPHAERSSDSIRIVDKDNNVLTLGGTLSESSGMGNAIDSGFAHSISTNADTVEMAKVLLKGKLREKFPMVATVDITGDPTIKPGGVVKVDNYGTKFDGYWYVKSVRHTITRSELLSSLNLAKDSTDTDTTFTINPSQVYDNKVKPALLRGDWISDKESVVEYA